MEFSSVTARILKKKDYTTPALNKNIRQSKDMIFCLFQSWNFYSTFDIKIRIDKFAYL